MVQVHLVDASLVLVAHHVSHGGGGSGGGDGGGDFGGDGGGGEMHSPHPAHLFQEHLASLVLASHQLSHGGGGGGGGDCGVVAVTATDMVEEQPLFVT